MGKILLTRCVNLRVMKSLDIMKKLLLVLIILTFTLAGCNTYLDVTPQQHAQIVEYTANLLLKYDRSYETNLVTISLPTPKLEEPPPPPPEPEIDEEEDGGPQIVMGGILGTVDMSLPRDLTEIIAIDGLSFNYMGSIVTGQYPNEVVPGEVGFVLTATAGTNLLVLRFNVVNSTGSDIYLDMMEYDLRLRVGYNGENVTGTMFTLLENDLSFFQGLIPAGEAIELAVLREAELTNVSEIYSVEFFVRADGKDFTFSY